VKRRHIGIADILVGAATIENALLARLRTKGIPVGVDDIEWNRGRGLLQAPEYLQLSIRSAGAPPVMRVFRRNDLMKSAHAITWHVRHQIEQIIQQCIRPVSPGAVMPQPSQPPKVSQVQDEMVETVWETQT
jgi:hypothetical protein